jgi:YidC/Oxa1 family membrane protein insertase
MNDTNKPFDSRAFLAFGVLLALVLLLPLYWEWIGYKPAPKPTKPVATATDSLTVVDSTTKKAEIAAPTAGQATSDSTDTGFATPDGWSEQLVQVSTQRYDAVFSTRGARLVKLVLKKFRYTDTARKGQPVVILDSVDATNGMGPRFRFPIDKLALDRACFTVAGGSKTLGENDSTTLQFVARSAAGSAWTITYSFHGGRYSFDTRLQVSEPWKDGLDRNLSYGWQGGLWPTEPDATVDNNEFAAVALMGEKDIEKVTRVDRQAPTAEFGGDTHWAAVRSKYFVCVTIPIGALGEAFEVDNRERPYVDELGQHTIKEFSAFVRMPIRVGEPIDRTFTVYTGPMDYDILKSYNVGLDQIVDLGWRWVVRPFALLLLWVFQKLHAVVPNYGAVIILFAFLIKAIFHPLTKKQITSMRKMQALQPKMEKLKERFKEDPTRLNQEMMKMYKEAGINPLSGCLPLLPQMPIFYAMFQVFKTSIELRGAGFAFWIGDLSQKDPYYVLPIIMTASMFLQQRLSNRDPKQKMLMYMLPLLFGFMFRNMPAGLNLYWTMFNIFSVVEQAWLIKHPTDTEAVPANGSVGAGKILSTKSG